MSRLFKNQYRVKSTRLPGWNYADIGLYFVTICTKDKIDYFGYVKNKQMIFNELGNAAHQCWQNIPQHFPHTTLCDHVIMPNHIHGILEIVETQNFASLHPQSPQKYSHHAKPNQFGPQSRNLGSIIRGFKIGVTKYAKSHHINFGWQPRFYEHIIRDDFAYDQIRYYMKTNPAYWPHDRNNLKK